jgi:lysozyme
MATTASASATPVVTGTTNTITASVKTGTTERLGKPWSVSDNLLQFLGGIENGVADGKNFAHQTVTGGFILTVYNDSKELATVGCGHLVVKSDGLKVGDQISLDKAKGFLKTDIAHAQKAVNDLVSIPLYQYEYDALVSVTYNTGRAGATPLINFVNKGRYADIPSVIKKAKPVGNEWRRDLESSLFKTGIYDASH